MGGDIFVQVGKYDGHKGVSAMCRLPGTKRRAAELPHAAVQRLMASDLCVFKHCIDLLTTEHHIETRESPSYGINTTYFRAMQYAEVLEEPLLEKLEFREDGYHLCLEAAREHHAGRCLCGAAGARVEHIHVDAASPV